MYRFSLRFAVALFVLTCFVSTVTAQTGAFDVTRMDTSVEACDNFYQYTNGNWLKKTEIPPQYSEWGGFILLLDKSANALRGILDDAAKTENPAGSNAQLSGDFYSACMDEAAIEKMGAAPLDPFFKQINQIKTAKDLPQQIARMHNAGTPAVFTFIGDADLRNTSMNIAIVSQAGLTLPDRDFYTNTDAKAQETRAKFVEYMTNVFKLVGDSAEKAAANAKTVLAIQTRLAKAHRTALELQDEEKNYNIMTVAKFGELTTNFAWAEYFKARNAPQFAKLNVAQPEFFAEVNRMLADVPIDDWKTYFRWMTINNAAPFLSKAFARERFNFFERYLNGTQEQQPRWRNCVNITDAVVGEALGAEYVKRNFTPAAEKRTNELIDNLFAAYRESIPKLDWMSPQTRAKALEKLNAYQRKIGFNKNPRGYKGLKLDRQSYFQNYNRAAEFLVARGLQDIGQTVDRTRWGLTAATINAYYNPLFNEIVFPAAILQPPFFNQSADDAINYGSVGAVIGHEITHGFDNQGSQFDKDGNFKSWWTPEDRKKFDERTDCLVKQFGGYEVQPGLNLNGELTLGENIADLGGLTMAWAAFQKSLEGKPRPANIDGFTPEQRFFLGWAQVWATKFTTEYERQLVLTDIHSNARWRVNGTVSNLPQFREAFGCKTGDRMVRAVACKIW